ncbi:uncharacterized protein LOC144451764 [Glandiceps talaboti]
MEEMPQMKTPASVEFRPSEVEEGKIGVWVKTMIKEGTQFGPYGGEKKKVTDHCDPYYSWEIRGPKGRRLFCIDAANPKKSNWLRYIKCARYNEEQNMIALQQQKQIYYKTIKDVKANEELLCWFSIRTETLEDFERAEANASEEEEEDDDDDDDDEDDDDDDDDEEEEEEEVVQTKTKALPTLPTDKERKKTDSVSKPPKKTEKSKTKTTPPPKKKKPSTKDEKQVVDGKGTTKSRKRTQETDVKKGKTADMGRDMSSSRKRRKVELPAVENRSTTSKEDNQASETNDEADNEELPILDKTIDDNTNEMGGGSAEESADTEGAMPVLEKMSQDSDSETVDEKSSVKSSKKIAEADSTTTEVDEKKVRVAKPEVNEPDEDAWDGIDTSEEQNNAIKTDSKTADSTIEDFSAEKNGDDESETKFGEGFSDKGERVYLPPQLDKSGEPVIFTDVKQFKFDITDEDIVRGKRRKPMYKCRLCNCMVEYAHSLKRHYFKHHIEDKYKHMAPVVKPVKIVHKREKIRTRAASSEEDKFRKGVNDESDDSSHVQSEKTENGRDRLESTDGDVPKSDTKRMKDEMKREDDTEEQMDSQDDEEEDESENDGLVIDEDAGMVVKPAVDKPVYPCTICGKVLKSPKRLSNHLLTHPKQNTMECPKCSRTFLCKQGLERHLLTHTGEKPHQCRYCGKAFSTTTNVRRHERLHSRDKKHPCDKCEISFIQASDLQKHLRNEHGDVEDYSSYATDDVPSEDTLEEEEEKVVIKIPKKKIKVEDGAAQHDEAEEVHSCPWCGKTFFNPTSLKRHASHAHRGVYSKPSKKQYKYGKKVVSSDEEEEEEPDGYVEMTGLSDSISENLSKYLDGKIHTNQEEEDVTDGQDLTTNSTNVDHLDTKLGSSSSNIVPQTSTSKFSPHQGKKAARGPYGKMKVTGKMKTDGGGGHSILNAVLTENAKNRFMPAIKEHVQKLVKSGTSSKGGEGHRGRQKSKPHRLPSATSPSSTISSYSGASSSPGGLDGSEIMQPPSPYTRPPYQGSSGPKDCGIFNKKSSTSSTSQKAQSQSAMGKPHNQAKSPVQKSPPWMTMGNRGSVTQPPTPAHQGPTRPASRSPRGPFFKPRDTSGKGVLPLSTNSPGSPQTRPARPSPSSSPLGLICSPTSITQGLKMKSPVYNPSGSSSKTSKTAQRSPVHGSKPATLGSPGRSSSGVESSKPKTKLTISTSPLFSVSHPLKRQAPFSPEVDDVLDLSVKKPKTEEKTPVSTAIKDVQSVEPVVFDPDQPLDLTCGPRKAGTRRSSGSVVASKGKAESSTLTKTGLSSQVTTLYARSEGLLARAGMSLTNQDWANQPLSPGNQSDDHSESIQRELSSPTLSEGVMSSQEDLVDLLSVSNEKSFTCNVCSVPFSSMKDLRQHVTMHAGEWKFKCEFCVQLFKEASQLTHHRLKKHRVGKTYVCSACEREFTYLSNLEQHQVDMHPNIRCTYNELGPGSLRRHNFTDPAKSAVPVETPAGTAEQNRISQLIEQAQSPTFLKFSPKKSDSNESPRKPVNPQRNHPFLGLRPGIALLGTATVESAQEYVNSLPTNQCTKCGKTFENVTAFHKHIFICAVRSPGQKRKRGPGRKGRPPKILGLLPIRKFEFSKKLKLKALKQTNILSRGFRARPGQKFYNPMNHTRRREKTDLLDTYKCQACEREFSNITKLERHMKVCPNRGQLRKESLQKTLEKIGEGYDEQSKQLLQQHRCPHCTRQFTYLQSLKKHTEVCNLRKDGGGGRLIAKKASGDKNSGGKMQKGKKKKGMKKGGRKKRVRDETVTAEQLMMMEILGDRPPKKRQYRHKAKVAQVQPKPVSTIVAVPVSTAIVNPSASMVGKMEFPKSKFPRFESPPGTTMKVEKLDDGTKLRFVNVKSAESILEKKLREHKQEDGAGANKASTSGVVKTLESNVVYDTTSKESSHADVIDHDTSSVDSDELPLSKLVESAAKKENKVSEAPVKMSSRNSPVKMSRESPIKISSSKLPVKMSSSQLPVKMSSRESPVKTSSRESPVKTSSHESPVKTSSHESPVKTSSHESPVKTSSRESPVKTSSHESPAKMSSCESPVKTSPRESPVKMSARESPVKMSARESPVKMSSRVSPVKMSSHESPVKTSSRESPVKMSSHESPVKMSPRESPVKTSPRESPVKPSPRESPVKTSPRESPVKMSSRVSPVKIPVKTPVKKLDVELPKKAVVLPPKKENVQSAELPEKKEIKDVENSKQETNNADKETASKEAEAASKHLEDSKETSTTEQKECEMLKNDKSEISE